MHRLVIILSVFLFACNNNAGKDEVIIEDSGSVSLSDQLPWAIEYDTVKGDFKLRELTPGDSISADPQTVIAGLNQNWPNVQLEYKGISGDTLMVAIPNAEYLTQRMGSSGPTSYFAVATYNLTAIKGIRYVKYDFEEGDHASPSVLNRDNFSEFK